MSIGITIDVINKDVAILAAVVVLAAHLIPTLSEECLVELPNPAKVVSIPVTRVDEAGELSPSCQHACDKVGARPLLVLVTFRIGPRHSLRRVVPTRARASRHAALQVCGACAVPRDRRALLGQAGGCRKTLPRTGRSRAGRLRTAANVRIPGTQPGGHLSPSTAACGQTNACAIQSISSAYSFVGTHRQEARRVVADAQHGNKKTAEEEEENNNRGHDRLGGKNSLQLMVITCLLAMMSNGKDRVRSPVNGQGHGVYENPPSAGVVGACGNCGGDPSLTQRRRGL